MTKIFIGLAIILLKFTSALSFTSSPVDSIGIEKKGDKIFILHRVEQKQTLVALLRRYNCSKEEFFEINPYLKGNPKIGFDQIVRIPATPKAKIAKVSNAELVSKTPKKEVTKLETTTRQDTTPKKVKQSDKVVIIDSDTQKEIKEEVISKPEINETLTEKSTQLKPKKHKVTLKTETLFGIAHQYKVPASKLREWNKLKSDFVQLGQSLIIEDPTSFKTSTKSLPAKRDTSTTKVIAQKPKKDSAITIKTAPKKAKKDSLVAVKMPAKIPIQGPAADVEKVKLPPRIETKPVAPTTPTYVPNAPGVKKSIENGVAEVIEAGEKTDKYLALHKSAPVGTLIQVRNEANGLSVWVKVIGKLPDSGETIIKISPKAFEKLQPRDKRIRAEISYVK